MNQFKCISAPRSISPSPSEGAADNAARCTWPASTQGGAGARFTPALLRGLMSAVSVSQVGSRGDRTSLISRPFVFVTKSLIKVHSGSALTGTGGKRRMPG